jgi:hypothetical protein
VELERKYMELERKYNERMLKHYSEGALDCRLDIRVDWTNENMRKIADTLAKGKILDFRICKAILHPTKDVGPEKHEKHVCVFLVASPFKVDEIAEALQKVGETAIDRIQCGSFLFMKGESDVTFLLKEEEP